MKTQAAADQFKVGQRVQLHPATDEWMQGDRYGTVVRHVRVRVRPTDYVATKAVAVYVKLDRSGRTRRFHPENISEVQS